ncbi:aldehyde dehydrogenase [Clostridium tetani]|uniref:Aldehyde dehydrogenase n=1 Tax=Clostridium tetani TaxID=1513 RepID=A0ABY0ERC1_CLOTA|nr:aldehyde dehydrogenase [Clostridium tetani]KHO32249.1 aldehyde dehydrogenase [Clostridium tetani]RXI57755.1 aldehyde dehydrogenase [Clostridium tetani]RXI67683.1 aldehyde dehydrogenase [Clostridium tetani]CDI50732.1 aldehyde dehydrogenase ywdH [Clostridium tetani 12124569]
MNDINCILENQKKYFNERKTRDLKFRLNKLRLLKSAIKIQEEDIMEALKKDLNKPYFESYETEIAMVIDELNHTIKNLPKWIKTKRIKSSILSFPSKGYIYSEPYGVVLIMSPWNYPFQLSIMPLIGAIAAGNCCIIKPSEYSTNTSKIVEDIVKEVFLSCHVCVIEGDKDISKEILREKFDYIFFTGSEEVGKIVMKAVAKNLTPLTLELGGKSPCIIDSECNLSLSAKRVVWGKFLNAGQTCVAPDYVLVHKSIKEKFINEMRRYINIFYKGESKDFPRIINKFHFQRLINLLYSDGNIEIGGQYNKDTLQLYPTIINSIDWESNIMKEEIFGPILPIIEYDSIDEVIDKINSRAKPLALYYFSSNKENQKKLLESTSFGGGCINDTIMHLASPYMPFGGVGSSGMGSYHGHKSFETFSHKKSILKRSTKLDINLRYPPYGENIKVLKRIIK